MVTVILAKSGATVGSTDYVIEADSIDEAEQQAIAAWSAARPECMFRPLLTIPK